MTRKVGNRAVASLDAIAAVPPRMREAQNRVEWRHVEALLHSGVPMHAMLAPHGLAFGVVTIQSREMVVTDTPAFRAYMTGPGVFKMPGPK